jgi:hypothetical protein
MAGRYLAKCVSKKRYDTRREAAAVRERMIRTEPGWSRANSKVYRCKGVLCQAYHIGRIHGGKSRGRG